MRFSHFFIDRPIFAAAVSVVITLAGLIAYLTLPVDQYPNIAPPTVSVNASYPGATAEEIADTVAAPLEQQINGITGMLYMSSSSTGEGRMSITVTFKNGTNVDIAQVEVQNRIQSVLPQLPQTVRDLGITVRKASTETLLIVHMFASDDSVDRKYIANYASLQVRERLLRTPGVGDVSTNAARDYAMRVWIDPEKAASRDLTVQEIVDALRNNNLQVAGGAIGGPPFDDDPAAYQLNVRAQGRLQSAGEFAQAIVKRDAQGRLTRIGDIARVELGAQNYGINAYKSLEPAVSLSVNQAPNTNALETWDNIRSTMEELKTQFPPGVAYEIIFNPVAFTREAVKAVQHTLLEAMILAIIVVVLFLQRWRTAIIPLLAIPISLVGTLAVMAAFGFSLNNLSMFALVLSIGIVVDDAIVVVENAERHLRAGMSPLEAAHRTMDEVGGALIGIALVLVAVFVPTAFMGGITGQFYKQFALTIASATAISLIVSLTLSPALAAVILKPHESADGLGPARAPRASRRTRERLARAAGRWLCTRDGAAAPALGAAAGAVWRPARPHGLARDGHAARVRPPAGPEQRVAVGHAAAGREPRALGCGGPADPADRPGHAGRVIGLRLFRHGRHLVQPGDQLGPDVADLRFVRNAAAEGSHRERHRGGPSQAARPDHRGRHPHHQSGFGARPRQHRRLQDDDRGPRRSRLSRARNRRPAAGRSGHRGSGDIAGIHQLQHAQPDARCRRRPRQGRDARRTGAQRVRDAADVSRPARTSTTSTCSAIPSR